MCPIFTSESLFTFYFFSVPSTEGAAMKMQDRKMRDQMSGRENTGSEFGGPDEGAGKCRAGK